MARERGGGEEVSKVWERVVSKGGKGEAKQSKVERRHILM